MNAGSLEEMDLPLPVVVDACGLLRRVLIVRHAERADGAGMPLLQAWPMGDPPLTATGALQAALTASSIFEKVDIGEVSAVYSSPARRCIQTARPIAAALGARCCVEPGLSDWTESGGCAPESALEQVDPAVLHFVDRTHEPIYRFPAVSADVLETWAGACQRYRTTAEGLAHLSNSRGAVVLCTHQAALEALLPCGWEQGHCAVADVDIDIGADLDGSFDDVVRNTRIIDEGGERVAGCWNAPRLRCDCSAWRDCFYFISSRETRPQLWRPSSALAAARPQLFWDSVALVPESGSSEITLTRSRKDRGLILFHLDDTGVLWHCASGTNVSLRSNTDPGVASDHDLVLVLAKKDPSVHSSLQWRIGVEGVLSANLEQTGPASVSVDSDGRLMLRAAQDADAEALVFEMRSLASFVGANARQ